MRPDWRILSAARAPGSRCQENPPSFSHRTRRIGSGGRRGPEMGVPPSGVAARPRSDRFTHAPGVVKVIPTLRRAELLPGALGSERLPGPIHRVEALRSRCASSRLVLVFHGQKPTSVSGSIGRPAHRPGHTGKLALIVSWPASRNGVQSADCRFCSLRFFPNPRTLVGGSPRSSDRSWAYALRRA